jgi:hypothetical protein
MQPCQVNVTIYGALASRFDGKYIAIVDTEMPGTATLGDLLEKLEIPMGETSFIFLDAVLCDVPGLEIIHDEPLKDGSHVGVFSTGYMWPYQYRDGIRMSDPLLDALREYGAMHNVYVQNPYNLSKKE